MNPHLRRLTSVALLAAQLLTGCTSWQVVDVSPRALVDSAHVTRMKVSDKGEARLVLEAPKVSGDSLVGYSMESGATRAGLPLAAVDRVAVRKTNGLITAVAIVIAAAIGLFVAASIGLISVCCS